MIFSLFILISLGIGLYHALTGGKQRTTEEFIMANRQLQVWYITGQVLHRVNYVINDYAAAKFSTLLSPVH